MPHLTSFEAAAGPQQRVLVDWMPTAAVHPLIFQDPSIVWLELHGKGYGFQPDPTPYLGHLRRAAALFEQAWQHALAPDAVVICSEPGQGQRLDKLRETVAHMQQGTPVLFHPALWWAPARIFGVPTAIARTSWLVERFPSLALAAQEPDPYVVLECTFASQLDQQNQARMLRSLACQTRFHSYMVGHLQEVMPPHGYLVARDRADTPMPVAVNSALDQPLDRDLAAIREQFAAIKVNGEQTLPEPNLSHQEPRWRTAKARLARENPPGGDLALLYGMTPVVRRALARVGCTSLHDLVDSSPQIPIERLEGVNQVVARRMRAILQANRSGKPVLPPGTAVPARVPYEFFVAVKAFDDTNIDVARQRPNLVGCEMLYMIGLGWERQCQWVFQAFVSPAEVQQHERGLLRAFADFVSAETDSTLDQPDSTRVVHWSPQPIEQMHQALERHGQTGNHPVETLPWCDLQRVLLQAPIGLPQTWTFDLRDVARSLTAVTPLVSVRWPKVACKQDGMVLGWTAYQSPQPAQSKEMETLRHDLEADCLAQYHILSWLRHGCSKVA